MSKERAIQLRLEGHSRSQIAELLGLKTGGEALNRWLRGVPPPEWTKRHNAKDDLRERAIALRRLGRSYNEILEEVPVAKSTLSLWLRDVLLEDMAAERLAELEHAGQQKGAAMRRAVRVARERDLIDTARSQMPDRLAESELFIAGLATYWAEGGKAKPWNVSQRVSFINSDPNMIRLHLTWLALIGVEPSRIRYRVHIHETGDADRALAYWTRETGVPASSFSRTTLKTHPQRAARRLPADQYFGCLCVDVRRSTDLNRQIVGWWQGLAAAAVSVEARSGMV